MKVDQSITKGLTDFFYVDQDTSDSTYNYYGYSDNDGIILVLRIKKDNTEARWATSNQAFATVWAARASLTYGLPNQLKKLKS